MKETWFALLRSKRAIVISVTTSVCALFVLTGKMPVSDFVSTFEKLGMLLAALYGAENVAAAVAPVVTVHNNPPSTSSLPIVDRETTS